MGERTAVEGIDLPVLVVVLFGVVAALGVIERWTEEHPRAAIILGGVGWVALFALSVHVVQWIGAVL